MRHWKRLPREAMDAPSLEGQAEGSHEQLDLVKSIPAHNSGVGLDDLQGSIST